MKRFLSIAVIAAGCVTSGWTSSATAQSGYFPEPPPVYTPNGYVYDPVHGWRPRASFFGGYNTGSYSASGRYGLYRRALPYSSFRNSGAPRYGGFGPGIGEKRRYGGSDYYAR